MKTAFNPTFSFEVLINNAKINFLCEFYKLPLYYFHSHVGLSLHCLCGNQITHNQLLVILIAPLWPIRAVSPNIGQY